jgi:mercuric ion transport protein
MSKQSHPSSGSGFLVAGLCSAAGASICCVGPFLLLSLGISGAWISGLAEIEPYRPIFIGLSILFLGLAFHRLYFKSRTDASELSCTDQRALNQRRFSFWLAAIVIFGLIAVPWFVPYLLK